MPPVSRYPGVSRDSDPVAAAASGIGGGVVLAALEVAPGLKADGSVIRAQKGLD